MIHAELKKLLRNGAFRIFFALFLLAGFLSPVVRQTDPAISMAYEAYQGMTTEEVLADIENRLVLLDICSTVDLAAQLPTDVAEIFLDGLTERYGMTQEEMAAVDRDALLRFTDSFYGETEILERLQNHATQVAAYGDYLESIRTQEQTIQNSILYRNNDYALALARKTADEYKDLGGLTLPLADPTAVETALGTWLDDCIGCGIVCLVAMFAFLQERQEGMTLLLFSTKRGRRATYAAKMTLVSVLGAGASLLLALYRVGIAGDLGELSRPVQTMPAFYASPYPISVGTVLVCSVMQRCAAVVFTGMVMSLLCIRLERSLALGIGALIAGLEMLCWSAIGSASVWQPLKYLSVPALFSDETLLGNAVFVKLVGVPIHFGITTVVILVAGSGGLLAVGGQWYAHSYKALTIPNPGRKRRWPKRIPGLFRLELGKLMIHQKGAILVLLVIALQPSFYDSFHAGITTDELRYLSALKSVEGPYTQEKQDSILDQIDELTRMQAQTSDQMLSEELGQRIAALNRVAQVGAYLAERKEPVCYVYETGYYAMFGWRAVGIRYQPGLIGLTLSLLLPALFTLEKESGLERLTATTYGWRRLKKMKWKLAALLSFSIFLICWIPEGYFLVDAFDLSMWNAPAASLQMLSTVPGWATIWMAVAALWFGRMACCVLFGALVCAISDKAGKYIPSVLLSILLLLGVLLMV